MIVLAGVFCGAILFFVFRRFTNRGAVRQWKRKRRAYVLGLYLFGDDPVVSLRGFAQIARANAMLLAHALPALAIAVPLIAGTMFALDRYETASHISGAVVVTAHWTGACEPRLETKLPVTAPPVHVPALDEVSWRVQFRQGAAAPRAGCNGQWVSTRVESAAPAQPWLLWFGIVTWATAGILRVAPRIVGVFALAPRAGRGVCLR